MPLPAKLSAAAVPLASLRARWTLLQRCWSTARSGEMSGPELAAALGNARKAA
eukprot:COSAG06_NODE_50877_length_315_cov_1.611111_1_plen_52_part_01